MKSFGEFVDQVVMEYQKRLKFIEYVKKNFVVSKNDMMVFNFGDYDNLDMVTAWKIRNVEDRVNYFLGRQERGLGTCVYFDTFGDGTYLDFSDSYLDYEEIVSLGRCINNSLNQSIKQAEFEVRSEIDRLIDELRGKQPIYRKSNC